jgi:glycosyltransferase involved in cell wall biosynthesis
LCGETLMRFAMVTTFYPPYSFGGDATYVRSLSRSLAALGHEVDIVHCADAFELLNGGPPPQTEAQSEPAIRVHRIHSAFGAASPIITQQTGLPGLKSRPLRGILDQDFDVIHFHNISLIGGPGVLRMGKAPVKLYTLHEHWLLCPTHIFWKNRSRACEAPQCLSCCLRSGIPPQLWRYTGLRDECLAHVDRLISPSAYTAERHREAGIARPIEILPMFSGLEGMAQSPQEQASLPEPYFLYVGRVTASKGMKSLMQTFAAASDLRLVVVGDGDLRSNLMREYTACANISFLGALPQAKLVDIYAHARALLLPSLAPETFGLTVIEAAANGVPAIVRQSAGGAPEFVLASGGGALYQDDGELLPLLRRFAFDRAFAAGLGERARAAYLRSYTRETHIAGYLRCIAGVVAHKSRDAAR